MPLPWRGLEMVLFLLRSSNKWKRPFLWWPGTWCPLLVVLKKLETHVPDFTGGSAVHELYGAESGSPQPCSLGINLGEQRLGFGSLWGCFCPFFGLVIHPNGLEIMTNHNNNSQLNKTSINRNSNWGWEEKWPLGILFRRDFRLWFPRQERWQISQYDSSVLEKEANHIFLKLPVVEAVELTVLQSKE